MSSFDLFFVSREGFQVEGEWVLSWLSGIPHLRSAVDDPTLFVYRNPDTSVHFSLILDPGLLPPPAVDGEDDEFGLPRRVNIVPDASEQDESPDDDLDEEDMEEDDEPGENHSSAVDLPPLTLNIPLFRPSFFVEEALQILESLRGSAGLLLVDPQEGGAGGGEPGEWDIEEILRSWQLANRHGVSRLKDPRQLRHWSPETCRRFYSYASLRTELERLYSAEGLEVARLYPAMHHGVTKTLCIWRTDVPVVLPRSDLVLVERPRERRGLLGRKKTILAKGLTPAEEIWRLLGPFVEVRREPVELIIFRQAHDPPAQVTMALDTLQLEPAQNARRTELTGVVDFELGDHGD